MASTAHVPAWRRLGLKLKHESNEPASTPHPAQVANGISRKRSREEHSVAEPDRNPEEIRGDGDWWKRRKQEEKRKFEESVNFIPVTKTRVAPLPKEQIELEAKPKKRKSVQFSADTKSNGERKAKETFGSTQANHGEPKADARKRYTEFQETKNTAENGAQSKPKRARRKKGAKANGTPLGPAAADWDPKYLDYLTTFYHSKDSWKFNKAKQTHLLRHVFELERVPWDRSDELVAYLHGLKGTAIREKLRTEAAKICAADDKALRPEAMDEDAGAKDAEAGKEESAETISRGSGVYGLFDPGRYAGPTAAERAQEYRQALQRFKREHKARTLQHEEWDLLKDEAWKKRLQTRMRAEDVLWCCGEETVAAGRLREPDGAGGHKIRPGAVETAPAPASAAAAAAAADAPTKKRKRKRKRRTGVPDDDSSSDETSSDESVDPAEPVYVRSPKANAARAEDLVSVRSLTPNPERDRAKLQRAEAGSITADSTTSDEPTSSESSSSSSDESDSGHSGDSADDGSASDGDQSSESESGGGSTSGSGSSGESGTGSGSGTSESGSGSGDDSG